MLCPGTNFPLDVQKVITSNLLAFQIIIPIKKKIFLTQNMLDIGDEN